MLKCYEFQIHSIFESLYNCSVCVCVCVPCVT